MNPKKNAPNPLSILLYVGIILFVLYYDKSGTAGNTTVDSVLAIAIAAGVFLAFGVYKMFTNKK